nr:ABC transporter substrate-binding protein [Dethiosulfovibrio faecalis]
MEGLFAIGITPVGKVEEYRIREKGMALPSVGRQPDVDIESIYGLNPSLVIGHVRFHGDVAKVLRRDGVPVFLVDPAKMGENPMLDSVLFLGRLLHREGKAREYADRTERIAKTLRDRIREETDVRSAVMVKDGDRLAVAQNATVYGSILRALGIENIVPDGLPGSNRESFIPFDVETVVVSDPDVVFIVSSFVDPEKGRGVAEKWANDPRWAGLKAVRRDRVIVLPFKVDPGRATAEELLRITAGTLLERVVW